MKKLFFSILFLTGTLCLPAQNGFDKTAMQIAYEMMPGWNLGNTLEASNWRTNTQLWNNEGGLDAEISWQGTRTTQEVIDYVKEQGFRSVRIPCAWALGHIVDAEKKTIDPIWMERVKTVVDYCINAGLYVVLNDHWDGGWLENHIADSNPNTIAENKATLTALWTQIAEAFKDYAEHLLFAGFNEPNAETQSATNNLMDYHQVFVDAVRATGGNNEKRILVVQGPSPDAERTCQMLTRLPEDLTPGRLAVEVHLYYPWNFWGMEKDESWGNCFYYWGEGNHVSGSKHNATYGEEEDLRKLMDQLKTKFVDKGVPVINGEYGVNWRVISGSGESQEKHDASIKTYYRFMNKECIEHGIVPMVWDTNSSRGMTVINRSNLSIVCPYMMEGIREGVEQADWSAEVMTPTVNPTVNSPIYNLHGQKVTAMEKGVYIQNGRKVLVK